MRKSVRSRRTIALIAAYVVALQAMLLPLSVAAHASFFASLCATSEHGSHAPGHAPGCPCAAGCGMQCCGHALASPPPADVAVVLTYARIPTPAPAIEGIVRPPAKGPQVARAPPAA